MKLHELKTEVMMAAFRKYKGPKQFTFIYNTHVYAVRVDLENKKYDITPASDADSGLPRLKYGVKENKYLTPIINNVIHHTNSYSFYSSIKKLNKVQYSWWRIFSRTQSMIRSCRKYIRRLDKDEIIESTIDDLRQK